MKRNTLQKEIIINTIKKYGHLTKEDVIEIVLQEYPSISASTVYRNLLSLQEDCIIRKCSVDNIGYVYEYIHDQHDHFICINCGFIKDIPKIDKSLIIGNNKNINEILKNYQVNYHQINYYGLCDKCKDKKE